MTATADLITMLQAIAADINAAEPGSGEPIAKAAARLLSLHEYVDAYCRCPCCEEYEKCLPDCRFFDGEPHAAADRMENARSAARG